MSKNKKEWVKIIIKKSEKNEIIIFLIKNHYIKSV